ncbi:hypothetical protein [Pedobacter sp. UYP30]|uniref:hypothetical protein n=1 Tax=Pedobacter sp. UYP30 TaxID=1756400 RepID=UPI0033919EA1
MTTGKKVVTIIVVVAIVVLAALAYYSYFFVFGEGVKAGELNYVVKKGYVFKTYEGKLIQSGLQSKAVGNIQNNEFEFSISDKAVADSMMQHSGKFYELHYKEYNHSLPWRGFSVFVVDSIISVRDLPVAVAR